MQFKTYTHYNAILTANLLPEIAQSYGIARSNDRALVTVSVLRAESDLGGEPVAAAISGYARNLAGQVKDLQFREIREDTSVYYLAEVPVADRAVLEFNLKVRPHGAESPFDVSFQRKFFEEPAAPYMRPYL